MKKILITVLLLVTLSLIWSAENGTEISRSNSGDLVRFKVVNTNATTASQAGFVAENDESDYVLIYVEAEINGSDAYIETNTGDLIHKVPTGKGYTFAVDAATVLRVGATGITTGTWLGSTIGATYGGTGVSDPADGCLYVGSGSGAMTSLGVLADGYVVVGDNVTDPITVQLFDDSATPMVRHEVGGLEADISDYSSGLIGMVGGSTADIDTKTGLETAIDLSAGDLALTTGDTFTGDYNLNAVLLLNTRPLNFEGNTDDAYSTTFIITDPTVEDKEVTFQDYSGTVVLDATACFDLEGDNLSITDGVLNASVESITADQFLYFWVTGGESNEQDGNWRVGAGATDLVWQVYETDTWVTKETKSP